MINGIATMAGECVKQIHRLNSTTHNIANVNSPGFKEEKIFFLEASSAGNSEEGQFLQKPLFITDYSQGIIKKTGNALDMAIKGNGFFVIQTKDGEAYTRDGKFTLNKNNELVTEAGDYVLGKSGKITISGGNVEIDANGRISADGSETGALKIVDFENKTALVRLGSGLFNDTTKLAVSKVENNPEIHSGYIELSNVQSINEMVGMIKIQRSFETYQKVMQTLQEQDKLSTNRIGRL